MAFYGCPLLRRRVKLDKSGYMAAAQEFHGFRDVILESLQIPWLGIFSSPDLGDCLP